MRTPDQLTKLFRASGRKVTAQRQCIFRVLQGNVDHPSAEAVHEAARAEVATISLKTVYQTLYELAEMGEIAALDLGTGMARFDPNVERTHHHLVCRGCGKVRDLNMAFAGLSVPPEEVQGYEVRSAEVVFRGLCGECRRPGAGRAVTAAAGAASTAGRTSSSSKQP
jgi:Fur family transcriptional regulator, stress-responsive regulator